MIGALQSLFEKFYDLLDRGLTRIASQITADIKADLQGLGSHIEATEYVRITVAWMNQNTAHIQNLQEQLESL